MKKINWRKVRNYAIAVAAGALLWMAGDRIGAFKAVVGGLATPDSVVYNPLSK